MTLFKTTIPGRAPVKKNTQRIVGYGRNKRAIYSPQFRMWHQVAMLTLKRSWCGADPIWAPIELHLVFFFLNRSGEADVSNLVEGVQDALEDSGVIVNDRQIMKLIAEKIFGQEPRVEIELVTMGEKSA